MMVESRLISWSVLLNITMWINMLCYNRLGKAVFLYSVPILLILIQDVSDWKALALLSQSIEQTEEGNLNPRIIQDSPTLCCLSSAVCCFCCCFCCLCEWSLWLRERETEEERGKRKRGGEEKEDYSNSSNSDRS